MKCFFILANFVLVFASVREEDQNAQRFNEVFKALREITVTVDQMGARIDGLSAKLHNDTDIDNRVAALEDEVDILEEGQIIQDERLNLHDEQFLLVEASVEQLLIDVDVAETTLEEHGQHLSTLDFATTLLQDQVAALQAADTDILNALELLANETTDEITGLTESVSALESTTEQHQQQIDDLDIGLQNISAHLQVVEDRVEALENNGTGTGVAIGFHAVPDAEPSAGTTVEFQFIRTNIGNRFDGSTFTADRAGLYYFSVYLVVDDSAGINNFYIRKNSVNVCRAYGEGDTDLLVESAATCSAVMQLDSGDEVDVYLSSGSFSPFEEVDQNGFTGFLIEAF